MIAEQMGFENPFEKIERKQVFGKVNRKMSFTGGMD